MKSDHPAHVWYERHDGTIRCALQDCQAEPTERDIAEVIRDVAMAASLRYELDFHAAAADA